MKNIFQKIKSDKNRMYGYHGYLSSTCSEQSNSIQSMTSSETCAQLLQNIFKMFIQYYWMDTIWGGGGQMMSQIMDLDGFFENWWCSRVPSTPTTKNYAGNEVSRPKSIPRKKMFFCRKCFSQYFLLFSTPQHLDFRDFADLGMCPSLPYGRGADKNAHRGPPQCCQMIPPASGRPHCRLRLPVF